ncbi:Rieske (2Fe-2S) domain-containing protein [Caballeronia temeraria]|jgi:3-phenylpropionate/trans-cinnamate dioxygenase ferredoxin subunit|uniref:Non-heme iron oxygenase ferredoxin subunit n=2 Tax=Caballeronia TaxID=1827195 RepID=A0AA37IJR9_9BURK|nr:MULTISPECIES: non-heme iron oxygenase ferredoxin subunit [Caballeronia]GJH14275.1 non-heme iron oxygenase ferredoxin subunit [Caballeronia novacaledonica]GJH31071.1 non-heme iron oxygenase ferredoxin subunit [Caballeronia novacaledonica]SAL00569.1 Rieske (2Fe-2S) domain-containing protein [Caballeronia temeraria]
MDEQWQSVGRIDQIAEDAPIEFKGRGVEVGVFKVGESLYAIENVCPHAYALLTQGFVDGDTVECPLHEAVFHIPTGKCLKEPGGRDLKMYAVRLAGEEIQIKVE